MPQDVLSAAGSVPHQTLTLAHQLPEILQLALEGAGRARLDQPPNRDLETAQTRAIASLIPDRRCRDCRLAIQRYSSTNRKNVDGAIARCGYSQATSGKVIAELTLGFWRQLTTSLYSPPHWTRRQPTKG